MPQCGCPTSQSQTGRLVSGDVFLRVPEGAVVSRVDGHGAVIAPAGDPCLGKGSVNNDRFSLGKRPEGITRQPTGVADGRKHANFLLCLAFLQRDCGRGWVS